jgi:death-on-curing protein
MLESAVAMPQAVFGGQELHPGLASKAAAYHFHLCSNHPFVDGNKRVGVAAAELFLILNGYELSATDDEIEEMTLGVARSEMSKDQVVEFFEKHLVNSTLE